MFENKRGNMGMGLMTGMITSVMVFLMLSAFLPAIIQMLGTGKGSNSANCKGYIDPNGLHSYNSSLTTDSITCSVLDFTPGMYTLSIIFAIIAGIISGRIANAATEPQPTYYPQYG